MQFTVRGYLSSYPMLHHSHSYRATQIYASEIADGHPSNTANPSYTGVTLDWLGDTLRIVLIVLLHFPNSFLRGSLSWCWQHLLAKIHLSELFSLCS